MDGVQSLTGCTLGKGNLIFKDHGKHVYTFLRRADGKAIRIVIRPAYWGQRNPEHQALSAKMIAGQANAPERARFLELQVTRAEELLEAPEEQLLEVQPVKLSFAPKVRVADYVLCESCSELTLKTHLQRVGQQQVCRPCAARLSETN